ncbi:hypothetical protein GM658_17250 [Pseudoduganella eburnea]|uniref:Uncharacterized protein n=1 Tax=Massilia eburnea TaxID=1776165 RepID=A0A6L6QL15_9BURK|nr:hypothetical protein [Massilia eburnea]MTW12356.1 hypothetical protein [Massilia eburnea]
MRLISELEANLVSGGEMEISDDSCYFDGGEGGGWGDAVDSGDSSGSSGTSGSSGSSAGDSGSALTDTARIAQEALACKIAIDRVEKSATYTNAAIAASTCSTAVQDFVQTVPWKTLMTNAGAAGMADAEARGFGMVKQK